MDPHYNGNWDWQTSNHNQDAQQNGFSSYNGQGEGYQQNSSNAYTNNSNENPYGYGHYNPNQYENSGQVNEMAERQHSFSSSIGAPQNQDQDQQYQTQNYDDGTGVQHHENNLMDNQTNSHSNFAEHFQRESSFEGNDDEVQAAPTEPVNAEAPAHNDSLNQDGGNANDNDGDDDDDDDDVIEILSNDGDANDNAAQQQQPQQQQYQHNQEPPPKRPRYTNTGSVAIMPPTIGVPAAVASYQARAAWLANNQPTSQVAAPAAVNPLMNGYNHQNGQMNNSSYQASSGYSGQAYNQQQYSTRGHHNNWDPGALDEPQYVNLPEEFVPTWPRLVPEEIINPPRTTNRKKAFALSLLNLSEFTITGLPTYYDGPPTPIAGLRAVIKRVSREHGQATFEKEADSVGGRWKIPIGAYHAFVAYLQSDPDCVKLETIPQLQLKIASLGRARLEKDYPSAQKLIERGVPEAIANTLAPFQRGGVDFVLEREGRALIADEMGLGKTIQSIASMAVYHKQWPLLVLTPSGARYHWESEFRNWLGVNGAAAKKAADTIDALDERKPASVGSLFGSGNKQFNLLRDAQIHVLNSSKGPVLPHKNVKVVICSYGLAPTLVAKKMIYPGMFECAIADESHMMKNSKSKRTQHLLPVLKACRRCILLSGTPALSKPAELWPQLQILQSEKRGFWDDEQDFIQKYVKNGNAHRRAELHAMLTGTLMIRRLKDDILKDMPKKAREKAVIRVESEAIRRKMQECMVLLRQGKGVMAKLARQHSAITDTALEQTPAENEASSAHAGPQTSAQSLSQLLNGSRMIDTQSPAKAQIEQEMLAKYREAANSLHHTIQTTPHQLDQAQLQAFLHQKDQETRSQLQIEYQERLASLGGADGDATEEGGEPSRATVLNKMYSLTGESKIPSVSNFLAKWLNDPTKGKICVFAHHISVLDAIAERVGLSNSGGPGQFKFIRIDGKTTPKSRQEQIDAFQTDPSVRVALLGITAAGVAVTLTASSHVIFAELFWTPALMIQAEDRCHRIGQRARVHCKYFVATGTLDEILWKLIEKKFRELGEFVEGKEKLKMIVHKTYKDEEELYKIFEYDDEDDDNDDEAIQPDQVESDDSAQFQLDNDLQHDIEELGKEEQAMVLSGSGDEDDMETEGITNPQQNQQNQVSAVDDYDDIRGRSQEDAIALSDDEDEEENEVEAIVPTAVNLENLAAGLNTKGSLPNCRIYKLVLKGPQLGVQIGAYKDRIVVSRKMPSRTNTLGEDCKPDVGDILVAVDNKMLPDRIVQLDPILRFFKQRLAQPQPTVLWFAEDAEFKEFYIKTCNPAKRPKPPPPKPTDEVVELLDD